MTAGIQIIDDLGFTQIDSDYRGLVLKQSVTLTRTTAPPVSSTGGVGYGPTIYEEPNFTPELFRWQWHTTSTNFTKYARAAVRLTSNRWVWMDFMGGRLFNSAFPAPPAGATFSIISATAAPPGQHTAPVVDIYDVPDGTDAGFGFQVFTTSGESAFYSNDIHMRVARWLVDQAPFYEDYSGIPWIIWANKAVIKTYSIPETGNFSVSMTQDCYGSSSSGDRGEVCRSFFRQRQNNSIEMAAGELYFLSNVTEYIFKPRFSTLIIRQGVA